MVGRALSLGIGLATASAAHATSFEQEFRCHPARSVSHATPRVIYGHHRLTRNDADDVLLTIHRNRMQAAGHFILAEVGCGAGCIRLASVDVLDGGVRWLPKTISNWPGTMLQPVVYRNDSRLVVVFGQLDERGPS